MKNIYNRFLPLLDFRTEFHSTNRLNISVSDNLNITMYNIFLIKFHSIKDARIKKYILQYQNFRSLYNTTWHRQYFYIFHVVMRVKNLFIFKICDEIYPKRRQHTRGCINYVLQNKASITNRQKTSPQVYAHIHKSIHINIKSISL